MVEINFNLLGKPLGDEWLSKGTSKIFNLIFNKQLSKLERTKLLTNAQNEYDANLIKSGIAKFENNIFSAIKTEQESNLANSLQNSIEYLNELSDDQISDEPVSQTFFNKWANYAKEASEEELQNLWGNILAKEISTPNTINYMALNALSLMSTEHLKYFINLLKYNIFIKYIVYSQSNTHQNFPDIPQYIIDDFLSLNLIKAPMGIQFTNSLPQMNVYNKENSFICLGSEQNHILYCVSDYENTISLPTFEITSIGKKLAEISESNIDISQNSVQLAEFLINLDEFKQVKNIEVSHRYAISKNGQNLYNNIKVVHRDTSK